MKIGVAYTAGYAGWAAVGAIALHKWRPAPALWPALLVIDWIARANLIHAALKAARPPTAACRRKSPERYTTAA